MPFSGDYAGFVSELKQRVASARLAAGRAVNRELVLLYWDIGRAIAEKQRVLGWGEAVVEVLAKDLRAAFPGMRGFSADNLWRVRKFYAEYANPAFLEQLVPEMPPVRRSHTERAKGSGKFQTQHGPGFSVVARATTARFAGPPS